MKKVVLILFLVIATGLVAACKSEKTQTVEWYMEHDAERTEMVKKCDNNPGDLEDSPNCTNAHTARIKKENEAGRKEHKEFNEKLKPLKAEDFKKK